MRVHSRRVGPPENQVQPPLPRWALVSTRDCVHVCVRVRVRVHACARARARARVCCVCVCARARACVRARVRMRVRERERVRVLARMCVRVRVRGCGCGCRCRCGAIACERERDECIEARPLLLPFSPLVEAPRNASPQPFSSLQLPSSPDSPSSHQLPCSPRSLPAQQACRHAPESLPMSGFDGPKAPRATFKSLDSPVFGAPEKVSST